MTATPCLWIDHLETPIGRLAIVADAEGRLRAAGFALGHTRMDRLLRRIDGARAVALEPTTNPGGLTSALEAYFRGDLGAIDGLPVDADGTEFQRSVWRALRAIPCGETRSYGELARSIGNAGAVRAVGLANGANPVSIVVPCHRVIGSDGSMTGYGGGVPRKRWLLAHEGAVGVQAALVFETSLIAPPPPS